jgi:hypothetical protein
MILGTTPSIYPLARFTERLTAAGRGVVRVLTGSPVSSGWLVTPTLVVVNDFVAADRSDFRCDTGTGDAMPARLAHLAGTDRDGRQPALFRLDGPLPGTEPLALDLNTAAPGTAVLVVHHPYGVPEAQLSLGRVLRLDDGFLHYDADTMGGSSGGPVLAVPDLGVLAMHVGRGPTDNNYALPLAAVLDGLRGAPDWPEIARRHGLADVAAAREPVPVPVATAPSTPGDAVVAVAMRWTFNPDELSEADREAVLPFVVNAATPRWSLGLDHRQRLLHDAGSLAALRALRRRYPGTEPGHEVIDRILEGPPYDLDALPLDTLPRWLQAVRWFDGTVPDLPPPAQVHRTLQRRRVREDLAMVAGPGFRGRTAELAQLNGWFTERTPGPMVLSGIGGIGKSALVARFAERLPATIPLFWLDFDRVDLAPDDAVSLLTELGTQAGVQLDGFTAPPLDAGSWPASAKACGDALTAVAPGPVLLVLDGFEIAQHAARHQEIWPVLEGLLASAPALRLLVSGRAPVTGLRLGGRDAVTRRLAGLDPHVAGAWLAERGVTDAAVRRQVVEASRGIPLVLKMAMRLLDAGGSVDDLPAAMIEGFLYHRILDRVVDAELQPVVRDALQLRAVSTEMLAAVLHDRIPPGGEAPALLDRLSRELAVVEALDEPGGAGPGVLRMRPEVRSAVLRLLTDADPDRVAEIDRRAAGWLAEHASDDAADAAELVYHRLRLGDVAGAEAAWREGCASRLGTAADDLFDPAAKRWLLDRLSAASVRLAAWEQDAAARIRRANKRGLTRTVAGTLAENHDRTADSPLLVHDAWVRRRAGDVAGAANLLDEAAPATGPIGRDRALVRAGLAVEAGERSTADRLLAGITDDALWPDPLSALAVQAARVRLTVDLEAELELAGLTERTRSGEDSGALALAVRSRLVPSDVLLPWLITDTAGSTPLRPLFIPDRPDELAEFAVAVNGERTRQRDRWPGDLPDDGAPPPVGRARELADRLAGLGEQRWRLATTTSLLIELRNLAVAVPPPLDPLTLAVVASLAVSHGLPLQVRVTKYGDIDNLLDFLYRGSRALQDEADRSELAQLIITNGARAESSSWSTLAVLLYVLSPDPLTLLIRRALGLPDVESER